MPPTQADLKSSIAEFRAIIFETGPRRFGDKHLAAQLVNYLEANLEDIEEALAEGAYPETGIPGSTSGGHDQTTPRSPNVSLLYLSSEDWEIIEDSLRKMCLSQTIEPEERARIRTAFESIGIVRGLEIQFEELKKAIEGDPPVERLLQSEANPQDGFQAVRFLPLRLEKDETAVAVVSARVPPNLTNESNFLESLIRATTEWTRDTPSGRSLLEFACGDLNIGDLASHGIDEQLSERLAVEGIHEFNIEALFLENRGQSWFYDLVLVSEIPEADDQANAETGAG
jgi:hypothetical protein